MSFVQTKIFFNPNLGFKEEKKKFFKVVGMALTHVKNIFLYHEISDMLLVK